MSIDTCPHCRKPLSSDDAEGDYCEHCGENITREPRATTPEHAETLIHEAHTLKLIGALTAIARSALDDAESGADTAAVVYEQLAELGIIVP